jgi:hypothetical protein
VRAAVFAMFGHTFEISSMTAGELHSERFILTFGSEVGARQRTPIIEGRD